MSENNIQTKTLPMLALRGLHVFPEMLLTFDVERQASVGALALAANYGQLIFLSTQKNLTADMPQEADVYQVGTVCRIRPVSYTHLNSPRAASSPPFLAAPSTPFSVLITLIRPGKRRA